LLRTLVASLALTHSPTEVRIHALESSNRLGSMADLPHVADVVGDDEHDKVDALLRTILGEIDNRKHLYRKHKIDSPAGLRAARASLPEGPFPDLFLMLDRWGDFAGRPETEDMVKRIADTGPEFAVHVVATVRDWNEVPDWMARLVVVQIELRLHQPRDSRIDPDRAAHLPEGPGWALHHQQPFRIAMPDIREPPTDHAMVDDMTDGAADLVARLQAPHSSAGTGPGPSGPDVEADFTALYGIDDLSMPDLAHRWRERPLRERLRIPLGATRSGDPVMLDLKQAADGGMGPHGLVAGATGAGKSELLRTIVLGLALHHGPDQVNFLLVDSKKGATFAPLAGLPHLAGHVCDVDQDLYLLERLQDILAGEIDRRQRHLREAGPYLTIADYEQARTRGEPLAPLPELVIVIEEFGGLLSGTSTFGDMLVRIARLGRSLGIHLLLGTARPDEWRLRALDSYLSYRIVLRTFSPAESRLVLGTTDAYHLPRIPGYGYLRTAAATVTRFRTAYASGPTRSDSGSSGTEPVDRPVAESLAVALAGHRAPVHRLWTDPLDEPPTVGMLLRHRTPPPASDRPGALRVPIGVIDVPRAHTRDVLAPDLSGGSGHLTIVGGPGSGKSTALRTLIMAGGATYTPEQVQFYCLDLGGALACLEDLPHVGSVAGRRDYDRVRRTVYEIAALAARREERFRELGITSMHEFRSRKARLARMSATEQALEPISADEFGDVFLVVDGLDVVHQDYPALEQTIVGLATRGPLYGIHVVVTLAPWTRLVLWDTVGTLIELRLGDPADSQLDRHAAGTVPPDRPGRGLGPDKLHLLIALPRLDSDTDPRQIAGGIDAAVRQLRTIYGPRRAPPLPLLPEKIPRTDVQQSALHAGLRQDAAHVVIGLGEKELSPVTFDFDAQQHLLAFADQGGGKTTLLYNIILGIIENSTREQARILLIDYRRSLLRVVDSTRVACCASATTVPDAVGTLCDVLTARIPGTEVDPDRMLDHPRWSGPEYYVIVDDYDLVVTDGDDPLEPLLEFLPMAHDVGLHVVLTRRASGVARALEGGLLGCLRDMSAATLLMSAPAEERKLFGGNLRTTTVRPGCGTLLGRNLDPELVQIAYLPSPQ
jgi:S-DNA-T family DNA segregation ATPase FtsK/SpoIIIE